MSKTLKKILYLLVLGSAMALAGCSSDDEGVNPTGTWSGQMFEFTGSSGSGSSKLITVVIDGTTINSITIDAVPQGVTGTLTDEGSGVFSFTLSDGTEGGFMITDKYAGFASEVGLFGAVTRDGGTVPTFSAADLAGKTASGFTVDVDGSGEITIGGGSSATCDSSLVCSGTDGFGNSFAASLSFFSLSNDFFGTFSSSGPVSSGNVQLNLSADRRFAAVAACVNHLSLPFSCTYSIWLIN